MCETIAWPHSMVGYKYPRADSNCRENLLCFAFFLDCKTVGFFLKISKEISKAWRKSLKRAKRASLTCFQPCSRPFVWLLARTWIRKNRDCFAVYVFPAVFAQQRRGNGRRRVQRMTNNEFEMLEKAIFFFWCTCKFYLFLRSMNHFHLGISLAKNLDLQVDSLVGNFKKISAFHVYALCFHETFHDKWC